MRILIATDAWHPQVNGVVRTLTKMAEAATSMGVDVEFLTPQSFRTVSLPSYADLHVALPRPGKIARMIEEAQPDYVHFTAAGYRRLAEVLYQDIMRQYQGYRTTRQEITDQGHEPANQNY